MKLFFIDDFLIDFEKSDSAAVVAILSEELKSGRLMLPNRFGRQLYDKYNDIARDTRAENMAASDVEHLLSGSDSGVYQIGRYVAGPLGFVRSAESRYLPPSSRLPLWHCSDTGCQMVHSVRLLSYPNASEKILKALMRNAMRGKIERPDWYHAFSLYFRRSSGSIGRDFVDLPVLIADAIPPLERRVLLSRALRSSNSDLIRKVMTTSGMAQKGSPDDLVSTMSDAIRLSLLMTLPDSALVRLIDDAVDERVIKIPATEIRRARFQPPRLSEDRLSSLSSLGIRADRERPALFMVNITRSEYEAAGQISEMTWKCSRGLRNKGQVDPTEYVRTVGPREFIKNLILTNQTVAEGVLNRLRMRFDPDESEDQTVDRIMWRCGFNPPRFSQKYRRIKEQVSELKGELLRHKSRLSDEDRDAIRRAGVNVFVSLENVLEEIVSFSVWLLSSDHFLSSKFEYRTSDALLSIAEILGNEIDTGENKCTWSVTGNNVLGTLLVYGRAAASWISSLATKDRANSKRPEDELPFYAIVEEPRFPFLHRQLWADCSSKALAEYAEAFDTMMQRFEQSHLASVRNGIDHYRSEDRFPQVDSILACQTRLESALDFADLNNLIPKIQWVSQKQSTGFDLWQVDLQDYAGRKSSLYGPPSLSGLPTPKLATYVINPFGNLLGPADAQILISPAEDSLYRSLWTDYPRRLRPPEQRGSREMNITADRGGTD